MLCREIMKTEVVYVSPDSPVTEAAQKMRDKNVGFLPVCDDTKKVVGTVTDRDLAIRVLAEEKGGDCLVGDVMTADVVSCAPDDSIEHAESLMSSRQKSRLLVIDEQGALQGVISLSDLAQNEDLGRVGRTIAEVTDREARP